MTQYHIMTNQVHSAITGTKTEENLHNAFTEEACTYMKYRLYANAARAGGNEYLARLYEDIASNEAEHAELMSEYLGDIGAEQSNLNSLIAAEDYASKVYYPEFADTAESEGFAEIAEKLRCIANAETRHSKLLCDRASKYEAASASTEAVSWLCPICGYSHTSDTAPERCPLCGRPGINFIEQND